MRLLIAGRGDEIPALFEATLSAVRNRELPLGDFLKKQTLKESVGEYRKRVDAGQRKPDAAYEAVIANGMTTTRGDRIAFYVAPPPEGEKKTCPAYKRAKLVTVSTNGDHDADMDLYAKKLEKVAKWRAQAGIDLQKPRMRTVTEAVLAWPRSPADSPPKNSPEKSTSPTAPPWHIAHARPPTTSANCEPRA